MDKRSLREEKLAARAALSTLERVRLSAAVVRAAAQCEAFRRARTVMLYRAVDAEVDLGALPAQPEAACKRFAYPVCERRGVMQAMVPGAWRRGLFAIPEPDPASSTPVLPEEIDLVIAPCAAFDDTGRRLGMGGGYYDRFLPMCSRAVVVVAAFEIQRAETVPAERWDVGADILITENGLFQTH